MASLPRRPPLPSARSSFYTRSKKSSTNASSPHRSIDTDVSSISSNEDQQGKPIRDSSNDTAIVGMACRLPGANDPSQLWENLLDQKDVQGKMPEDRFNVDAFYHPDGTNKGTVHELGSVSEDCTNSDLY